MCVCVCVRAYMCVYEKRWNGTTRLQEPNGNPKRNTEKGFYVPYRGRYLYTCIYIYIIIYVCLRACAQRVYYNTNGQSVAAENSYA